MVRIEILLRVLCVLCGTNKIYNHRAHREHCLSCLLLEILVPLQAKKFAYPTDSVDQAYPVPYFVSRS